MKKWQVTLGLSGRNPVNKVEFARAVVLSMTGNPYFPTPHPSLSIVSAAADALETAWLESRDSSRDKTALMRTKEAELDKELNELGNYVEDTANNDAEIGDTIIFSAGMDVRPKGGSHPRIFAVSNTEVTGQVKLTSAAGARASYVWQYTLTPNDPDSWITVDSTKRSTTLIDNLTPGKRYYFRAAIVTSVGQGPWQGPVDTIVT